MLFKNGSGFFKARSAAGAAPNPENEFGMLTLGHFTDLVVFLLHEGASVKTPPYGGRFWVPPYPNNTTRSLQVAPFYEKLPGPKISFFSKAAFAAQ